MRFALVLLFCSSVYALDFSDLKDAPSGLTENQKTVYAASKDFLDRDSVRAHEWLAAWSEKLAQKQKDDESYTAERFIYDRAREKLMTAVEKVDADGEKAVVSYADRREFARLVIFAVLRKVDLPEKLKDWIDDAVHAKTIETLLAMKELAKK